MITINKADLRDMGIDVPDTAEFSLGKDSDVTVEYQVDFSDDWLPVMLEIRDDTESFIRWLTRKELKALRKLLKVLDAKLTAAEGL